MIRCRLLPCKDSRAPTQHRTAPAIKFRQTAMALVPECRCGDSHPDMFGILRSRMRGHCGIRVIPPDYVRPGMVFAAAHRNVRFEMLVPIPEERWLP